jgi:hypothetical protein
MTVNRIFDLLTYPARDRVPCLLLFGATGMGIGDYDEVQPWELNMPSDNETARESKVKSMRQSNPPSGCGVFLMHSDVIFATVQGSLRFLGCDPRPIVDQNA